MYTYVFNKTYAYDRTRRPRKPPRFYRYFYFFFFPPSATRRIVLSQTSSRYCCKFSLCHRRKTSARFIITAIVRTQYDYDNVDFSLKSITRRDKTPNRGARLPYPLTPSPLEPLELIISKATLPWLPFKKKKQKCPKYICKTNKYQS